MLIGIDASRANRKHKSGTEWYSYYLIKELAQIDSKNQYVLYADKPLQQDLTNLCDDSEEVRIKFDQQGYQVIKSPHNNFKAKILGWRFGFLWTQARLSLEMIWNRPDVLFIPSHALPYIHPKKSIITIHDIGFERDKKLYLQQAMGPRSQRNRRVINLFVRLFTLGKYGANIMDYFTWSTIFGLKHAKKIITVSEFTKREISEIYGTKLKPKILNNIKVIHNGYNERLYKKIEDYDKITEVLQKYDIEPPFILYVGRVERKKNIPAMIEAFGLMQEKTKDFKLVLVGAASYGYDEVKYMISEYQLDEKVIRTGWVDEEDMPCLYAAATAFVFPSLYEGFGIPLLQAMACGVPILTSDSASIPEVVGDAALFCNPQDVAAMANAMHTIITEPALREKLAQKGMARVREFNWTKTAEKVLAEFENFA